VGDWSPQNYEERYAGGVISYRDAFARSSNVAAVRVAQEAGLADVVRAARELGCGVRFLTTRRSRWAWRR
jgi:penicillin-binding protein 1A